MVNTTLLFMKGAILFLNRTKVLKIMLSINYDYVIRMAMV